MVSATQRTQLQPGLSVGLQYEQTIFLAELNWYKFYLKHNVSGRGCIYTFLDYNNDFYGALKLNFILTVPVGSAVFFIAFGICKLRDLVQQKILNKKYAQVPIGSETATTLVE